MTDTYLGPVLLVDEIEQAVVDHFMTWEETYLSEVERAKNEQTRALPQIASFQTRNEFDKFPEDQLPALVVVSPGIVEGSIEREGDGSYSALWDVGIAVVSSGQDETTTRQVRSMYGAVLRMVFLQHKDISIGIVEKWVDESYKDIPVDASRSVSVVQLIFQVRVEDILRESEGLREPLEDPYEEEYQHPVAEDVSVEITRMDEE